MKEYFVTYKNEHDIWKSLAEMSVTTAHASNPGKGDVIYLTYCAGLGMTLAVKLYVFRTATKFIPSRYTGKLNKVIPVVTYRNTPVWLNFDFKPVEGGVMKHKDRDKFCREYENATFLSDTYIKAAA